MEHGHPNLTRGPFWEGRGVAVGGGGGNQPKKQGKSGKMGMKMGGNREEKGNLGKLAPADGYTAGYALRTSFKPGLMKLLD